MDQDILEGITRASVIELAKTMGIEVIERPVDKTELFIADEVFLTGTAAKISPIRQLESTVLSDRRPIMEALRTKLVAITEGRDEQFAHWVTPLSWTAEGASHHQEGFSHELEPRRFLGWSDLKRGDAGSPEQHHHRILPLPEATSRPESTGAGVRRSHGYLAAAAGPQCR